MKLFSILDRAQALAPQVRASTDAEDRGRNWAEVHADVLRTARGLAALGVGRGSYVAILALNDEHWLDLYFSLWRLGAIAVPLNLRLAPAELEAQLRDCGARVLVTDGALAGTATPLAHALDLQLISWGPQSGNALPLSTLGQNQPEVPDADAADSDIAGVFYTSGTTGKPKGVLLSHAQLMLAAVLPLAEGANTGWRIPSLPHTAPLFHLSGAVGLISGTLMRITHVFTPKFEAGETLRLIAQYRPASLMLAPVMLRMLMDHPAFATTDLSSVQYFAYGSAPMPESLLRRALKALPHVGFVQGYGMTETAGAVTLLASEDHDPDGPHPERLRSAGRPGLFSRIRVVDPEGRPLPTGQVGEVWVRTPTLMSGYLNQPQETAKVMADGWYRTGDGGRFDEHGYLYIVDRLKDMIVTGGENVYSAEVEAALGSHPAVEQAAVFGVPDSQWGERVHAEVLLRRGASVSSEELIAHCRQHIAGYKLPRSLNLRTEPLPLSAAGKIQKHLLRAAYRGTT